MVSRNAFGDLPAEPTTAMLALATTMPIASNSRLDSDTTRCSAVASRTSAALAMMLRPSGSTIPTVSRRSSPVPQPIRHGIDLTAQIDGDDVSTLLCETDRVAATLPTGGAGYESHFAEKHTHS